MLREFIPIKVYDTPDQSVFDAIQRIGEPALLKHCDFGKCFSLWSPEYLSEKIGDKIVNIHTSMSNNLNFIEKNFTYQRIKFNDFIRNLIAHSKDDKLDDYLYLRSTSDNVRSRQATKIEQSFPSIAEDLKPPNFIPYSSNQSKESAKYFSSVLRIASNNVQIWTHFDLYDNVLCQVLGTKRVVLFKPNDLKYLYVVGDKSLIEDLDNVDLERFPKYVKSTPYHCILKPGDVLFIPGLWWHNIKTLDNEGTSQDPCSIGFNIFWRGIQIDDNLFDPVDVYGNKNLLPMNTASAHVDKALAALRKMPEKYRQFYILMLLQKLKHNINSK